MMKLKTLLSTLLLSIHLIAAIVHAASDEEPETNTNFIQRLLGFPDALTKLDLFFLSLIVTGAFELLNYVAMHWGEWFQCKSVPVRGKHLDDLQLKDIIFVAFSKANTAPFTYFYFSFVAKNCLDVSFSLTSTVVALFVMFVLFDLVYTTLHGILHIPSLYESIHKHHHQQKAPSRATVDAVNVNPIEYMLGEYNHLLALFLCHTFVTAVHPVTTLVFLVVGGLMAALNHTRHDVTLKIGPVKIYDSKDHDVHHRVPRSNYGQYTMLWDRIFGTYRPYNPNDRINPAAQLNPKTGKSKVHEAAQEKLEKHLHENSQLPADIASMGTMEERMAALRAKMQGSNYTVVNSNMPAPAKEFQFVDKDETTSNNKKTTTAAAAKKKKQT